MKVRKLVKLLNERMESGDYRGAKELVLGNPDEAAKAANFVRQEYRYIVKALVLDVIRSQRQDS